MAMLGANAKLYYRSGGDYDNPTWTEGDIVSDVDVKGTWDQAEANARYSRIKLSLKALLDLSVETKLLKRPGNAIYEFLMNAAINDDVNDFLVLDGPRTQDGVRGWRFDGQVFDVSENQALDNALYNNLMFKPSPSDNPPVAVKVIDSALAFSDPGPDGGFDS